MIEYLPIAALRQNTGQIEGLPSNPRQWTQTDIDRLAKSLEETPELFEARPLIVYPYGNEYVILGGNLRYEGAKKNKMQGVPVHILEEERTLSQIARAIYRDYPHDGKYILNGNRLIVCQSNAKSEELAKRFSSDLDVIVNPLGDWTGGCDVDAGATNRKLGSDMAQSVTGGGLHGKDLSKADVSVNIYAFCKAQETGKVQEFCCAIGDDTIDGKPYAEIVEFARQYISNCGGFEKFAEWGLY